MGKWKQRAKRARETANIYADNLERMTDLAAILQNEVAELKQASPAPTPTIGTKVGENCNRLGCMGGTMVSTVDGFLHCNKCGSISELSCEGIKNVEKIIGEWKEARDYWFKRHNAAEREGGLLSKENTELKKSEAAFNLAIENAQAEIAQLKIALAEKSQTIADVALYFDAIADRDAKQGKCSRVQSKIGTEAGEVCNRNQCQGLMIRHRSYFYCNVCDARCEMSPVKLAS